MRVRHQAWPFCNVKAPYHQVLCPGESHRFRFHHPSNYFETARGRALEQALSESIFHLLTAAWLLVKIQSSTDKAVFPKVDIAPPKNGTCTEAARNVYETLLHRRAQLKSYGCLAPEEGTTRLVLLRKTKADSDGDREFVISIHMLMENTTENWWI
jgi:hypothetical protein